MRTVLLSGAAVALALTVSACGDKPSAITPANQNAAGGLPATSTQASLGDPRDAPIPQVDGKPMWAANRKHTAQENAQYQFTKNGGDFGAGNEAEYIRRVHAFIERPPGGAETLDRSNGDRLIYDAKANTFAVVSRDGAPRTMFKPRGGASYWTQQKQREAKRGKSGQDGGDRS